MSRSITPTERVKAVLDSARQGVDEARRQREQAARDVPTLAAHVAALDERRRYAARLEWLLRDVEASDAPDATTTAVAPLRVGPLSRQRAIDLLEDALAERRREGCGGGAMRGHRPEGDD